MFQEMDLKNISPRRSNQVCPNIGGARGIISVTTHVTVHLKEVNGRDVSVFKYMVNLGVSAEG